MKVVTIVGNRPQFVKAAAVSGPLRETHEEVLVHTGQHYDDELSAVFFEQLAVPAPDHELRLGSGSNSAQTSRMLGALEPLLADVAPDVAVVFGDTNSTLAGGLAAAQLGIPVAHVEAGMRSFDRTMPEELNRVLTDHLSALLLCPTPTAVANLEREGIAGRAELVGDVMADVAALISARVGDDETALAAADVRRGAYALVTAHRAGNVDDPARLDRLVALIEALPLPAVLPLHPRTRARLESAGLLARLEQSANVVLRPPLGYLEFAALLLGAQVVLTDSGGVQKEAYLAGVPCITLRDRTEWVETVASGWNVLVDLDRDAALAALERPAPDGRPPLYGDGDAGRRVVAALSAAF